MGKRLNYQFTIMQGTLLKVLLAFGVFFLAFSAFADEDYLPPEVAFKFSAHMADAKNIEVNFVIADGYYMYRERFAFQAEGAKLGAPVFPPGKVKFDDTFQKNVETYRHNVTIKLPVEASGSFALTVTSQGCADKGLCYAPMASVAKLTVNGKGGLLGAIAAARSDLNGDAAQETVQALPTAPSQAGISTSNPPTQANVGTPDSEMGKIGALLKGGKLLSIVPLFMLLGLGLAFTPCVLPMVPILSFIIVGEGAQASRKRSLLLSLVYSLGMALVYTALGIAAGLLGEGLSASLQHPAVLTAFALLMVVLSLAMFGVYQLQMPAAIQTKLAGLSVRQKGGKLLGVLVMGALSALIVGPCVAAPLAGALIYISQTRDVVIGGSALFAMAVGMSIPLLLVGLSAGTLLPRAGVWMEEVKRFFGVLMLAMALWMIAPILPSWVQMLGWAILASAYAVYLLGKKRAGWLLKTCGALLAAIGLMQLVGLATGATDPLAPLARLSGAPAPQAKFIRVKSTADLDAALQQANGKIVMLDFYADWCVSCKEMEKFTFSDPRIQAQFAEMVLLQADVTANNADDKALLKRFNLFGPPGIIFFNPRGEEIHGGRVIGYQNTDKFLQSLGRARRL